MHRTLGFLAFVFATTFSGVTHAKEGNNYQFFSWYNGWGSHRVWGAGIISGSYADAIVRCGELKIKVIPIYDTHSSHKPPTAEQSEDYAKTHNVALVKELKRKDITCAFEKEPDGK